MFNPHPYAHREAMAKARLLEPEPEPEPEPESEDLPVAALENLKRSLPAPDADAELDPQTDTTRSTMLTVRNSSNRMRAWVSMPNLPQLTLAAPSPDPSTSHTTGLAQRWTSMPNMRQPTLAASSADTNTIHTTGSARAWTSMPNMRQPTLAAPSPDPNTSRTTGLARPWTSMPNMRTRSAPASTEPPSGMQRMVSKFKHKIRDLLRAQKLPELYPVPEKTAKQPSLVLTSPAVVMNSNFRRQHPCVVQLWRGEADLRVDVWIGEERMLSAQRRCLRFRENLKLLELALNEKVCGGEMAGEWVVFRFGNKHKVEFLQLYWELVQDATF